MFGQTPKKRRRPLEEVAAEVAEVDQKVAGDHGSLTIGISHLTIAALHAASDPEETKKMILRICWINGSMQKGGKTSEQLIQFVRICVLEVLIQRNAAQRDKDVFHRGVNCGKEKCSLTSCRGVREK